MLASVRTSDKVDIGVSHHIDPTTRGLARLAPCFHVPSPHGRGARGQASLDSPR